MAALVAHRGDAARFPENTVPALRGALDAGARWLECDVQLSRDRVPMLLHDGDLARTFDDPRSVFDLDADVTAIVTHLSHDPSMAVLMTARPPVRVFRGWDGFEVAARSIIGQICSPA